jgi:hypothetical protein
LALAQADAARSPVEINSTAASTSAAIEAGRRSAIAGAIASASTARRITSNGASVASLSAA